MSMIPRSRNSCSSVAARLLTQSLAPFASVAVLVGCGDSRPPVYHAGGVVEFADGAPAPNAVVEFVPDTPGRTPRGRTDSLGRFELGTYTATDGAQAGAYRVVIVQPLVYGGPTAPIDLGEAHADHTDGFDTVSLKHSVVETTGLTAEVTPDGPNDFRLVVDARAAAEE